MFPSQRKSQPAQTNGNPMKHNTNSHFLFQELNNRAIADHIEAWLEARGL